MKTFVSSLTLALALLAPLSAYAYGQSSYQAYYQSYYQSYYQLDYYTQGSYQTYYQTSYSGSTGPLYTQTNYTLMCTIPTGGTASDTETVFIQPQVCLTGQGSAPSSCSGGAPQCQVKSTEVAVHAGELTTLSWCCPNSAVSSISNSGTGSTVVNTGGASSGSVQVTRGTYTLTCTLGGVTIGTGVTTVSLLGGEILSLTATPLRVRQGEQVSLTWSTSNMTSCTLKDHNNQTLSTATNESTGLPVQINGPSRFSLQCIDTTSYPHTSFRNVLLVPRFQEI